LLEQLATSNKQNKKEKDFRVVFNWIIFLKNKDIKFL
jgi:hypothetical protein